VFRDGRGHGKQRAFETLAFPFQQEQMETAAPITGPAPRHVLGRSLPPTLDTLQFQRETIQFQISFVAANQSDAYAQRLQRIDNEIVSQAHALSEANNSLATAQRASS
jgi:hypothetical protein